MVRPCDEGKTPIAVSRNQTTRAAISGEVGGLVVQVMRLFDPDELERRAVSK